MGKAKQYLIETKKFWEELYSLAKNLNTGFLQWELLREIRGYFFVLEPFTYKFRKVKDLRTTSWGTKIELWIGTSLVKKASYQQKGSSIRGPEEFVTAIRAHGLDLVHFVRRPIQETFHQLVLETKALKFFTPISVSRPFGTEVIRFGESLHCEYKDVFTITSQYPERISFSDKPIWGDHLFIIETMIQFEDHLDILKDAYRELHRKIQIIINHNKPILKRMKKLTIPFRLAKRLKT